MLTFKEFEVIKALLKKSKNENTIECVINNTYYDLFSSTEEINKIIKSLEEKSFILDGEVAESALVEIEPCKVNNAIILAAGGAAKTSKALYSLPKGLYIKNGETLIERQIKQLKEAGIDDITVVLGYRQELFLFLAEKYGVKLANTPAIEKGNVVTLDAVKDRLSRTYICSSDNYFVKNPFSLYEYNSFHATVIKNDCTREVQVKKNRSGRIVSSYTARGEGECFYGHAFLDERFSMLLTEYLSTELDVFRVDMLFWEELAMRHIEDLDWYTRCYPTDFLFEFDSISEMQSVETLFINDVSEKMTSKICDVLDCTQTEISDIVILDKGMTNINLTFKVRGQKYMFRYPGESSWELTDKNNEVVAQQLAKKIGLDDSCIFIDNTGCKISKFRDNLMDLSEIWWTDTSLICKCAKMMRLLHDSTSDVYSEELLFDPIAEGDRLMNLASARKGNLMQTFGELRDNAIRFRKYCDKDQWAKVICHHDWKYDNILVNETSFDIIDWEYGSIDDPGSDLLRLLMGRDYNDPMFDCILDAYFDHPVTKAEKMHIIAAFIPQCYYWLGWLMYQESLGNNGFYWTILYYQTAQAAIDYAHNYYENKQ